MAPQRGCSSVFFRLRPALCKLFKKSAFDQGRSPPGGEMCYFMWGLELAQQHFCSGHREVDKKRPASLAPPPLLFLCCLQRPDTYRLVLVNRPPLLHRLPLDGQRGDGNVDSFPAFSLQSASSPGPKRLGRSAAISEIRRDMMVAGSTWPGLAGKGSF